MSEQDTAAGSKKNAKAESNKNPEAGQDKDTNQKEKNTGQKEKPVEVKIEFDGIEGRTVAVPTSPAAIKTFAAAKGFLYYSTAPLEGLSGPLPGEESVVHAYDLKERKEKTVISNVQRFALSFDGSKLLYEAAGGGPRETRT